MLSIELEPGESVRIGNFAVVTLREKSGRRARIEFQADKSIPIRRVTGGTSDARMAASGGITGEAVPA